MARSKAGLMPRAKNSTSAPTPEQTPCSSGMDQRSAALLESGLSEDSKPFDFIGTANCARRCGAKFLWRERGSDSAGTRRYAKRQLTWFRKEQGVRWFSGFGDDPGCKPAFSNGFKAEGLKQLKLFG